MVRAMTVRIGGYTALERPDGGHRATGAALWRGEDDAGDPVGLLMLPISNAEKVRRVVDAAAGVAHPHLLPVTDVITDDDRIAVVSGWPRGGRLLELIRRRGPLNAGQALTVLVPLASALAAVHRAGVRHAGVGAGAVFFDEHGRPYLTAVAISTLISDVSGGLPGDSWDVAPEVVRGERLQHAAITPAADVFSLGSVALYCLTGSSAWPADDPADVLIQSTAGVWPEPPEGAGPPALLQLIRRMLLDDPAARPVAADLVGMLAAIGAPSPVPFGPGSVPAASTPTRWGGWADRPGTRVGDPSGTSTTEPVGACTAIATQGRHGVRRPPAQSRFRAMFTASAVQAGPLRALLGGSPTDPSPLARAGIAVLTVTLVMVVAVQVWVWSTGSEDASAAAGSGVAAEDTGVAIPTAMPADTSASTDTAVPVDTAVQASTFASQTSAGRPGSAQEADWRAVVTALDEGRGRALSTGDPALLDEVYVSGSAAAEADEALIRSLARRGWRIGGAVHRIDDVTVVRGGGAAEPARAPEVYRGAQTAGAASNGGTSAVRVVVRGSLPAYPVLDADGHQIALTAARSVERRIFSLVLTDVGYRISAVDLG